MSISEACWLWTDARFWSGYGAMRYDGKASRAHRVIYELMVGKIPAGMELDHICRQRGCVNPAHLRPVTHRENLLAPGAKTLPALRSAVLVCPQGHAYTPKSTKISRDGSRRCRICAVAYGHAYRAKQRAADTNSPAANA